MFIGRRGSFGDCRLRKASRSKSTRAARIERRITTRYLDRETADLDEALRWADEAKAAGDAVMRDAPAGDAPTYKGYPDRREFNESVEDEVDALTCPHCGDKVPRG